MLNLLCYRDRAEYVDSRETALTGAAAYQLYATQMTPFVKSKGGNLLVYGAAHQVIVGSIEAAWDTVAIMEYPSQEAFVEIVATPEVQGFSVHRSAGLKGQLLIATSQGNP